MKATLKESLVPFYDAIKELYQSIKLAIQEISERITIITVIQFALSILFVTMFPFLLGEISKILLQSIKLE